MKKKILYTVWGVFYLLCVGLGCIPRATGFGKFLLVLIGVLFFTPGVMLLHDGLRTGCSGTIRQIRLISAASLALTLVLLVANFLSAGGSAGLGTVLYALLVLFSAPMACCQYWVLSLFLWACLLMATFVKFPKSIEK